MGTDIRSAPPVYQRPSSSDGLRPSDSPTRSLARRYAGSLPPPPRLRRTRRSASGAKAGRARGSFVTLIRVANARCVLVDDHIAPEALGFLRPDVLPDLLQELLTRLPGTVLLELTHHALAGPRDAEDVFVGCRV